jgi:hypothetical protein
VVGAAYSHKPAKLADASATPASSQPMPFRSDPNGKITRVDVIVGGMAPMEGRPP